MTACAVAALSFSSTTNAQTVPMTADVTVLNTLTLTPVTQLNFGTVAAAGDPALQATFTVNTDGTFATATAGAALLEAVDSTAVSAGQITVADGADGATINITIDNVVDPVNTGESFELDSFVTNYNGIGDNGRVIGTPFTETFDAAFGGGVNTLDIGATISTTVGAAAYTDNAYAGTYDVIFSY